MLETVDGVKEHWTIEQDYTAGRKDVDYLRACPCLGTFTHLSSHARRTM